MRKEDVEDLTGSG